VEHMVQVALIAGDGILSLLVGWAGWKLNKFRKAEEERKKRNILLDKASMLNLRMTILRECNHYIEKGFAPYYAVQSIDEMYGIYHELGGNGGIESLMEDFKRLPHVAKEASEK